MPSGAWASAAIEIKNKSIPLVFKMALRPGSISCCSLRRLVLQRAGCDMPAAQELHYAMEQTRSHFMALVGACDVTNHYIHAERRRPNHNRRTRCKGVANVAGHGALPLLLCQLHI